MRARCLFPETEDEVGRVRAPVALVPLRPHQAAHQPVRTQRQFAGTSKNYIGSLKIMRYYYMRNRNEKALLSIFFKFLHSRCF